jgi:uncharacterized flavoprotein (TIGR03862 family)
MAAETMASSGMQVHVFDSMPSAGRKFLLAGKGGLNLTHFEPFGQFLSRYGKSQAWIEPILKSFGPGELRQWASDLGIETFVGSSNRIFPVAMRSTPLLRAWLNRLLSSGVIFHFKHLWKGWDEAGFLLFDSPGSAIRLKADVTILALGGGSWSRTGSTGAWVPLLQKRGIPVHPLKPSNCGFDVAWTDLFRDRYQGKPIKSVVLTFTTSDGIIFRQQGEFIITAAGVEGSLIYACSSLLRDEIEKTRHAVIHLDLTPTWTHAGLTERLSQPRGSRSVSHHLERTVNIKAARAGLLWEFVPKSVFSNPEGLASAIKDLQVDLLACRPLDEAISSEGGVDLASLMLSSLPGVFCAGEMLDWEAPTGGYLLTACFSLGRWAGKGALAWLRRASHHAVETSPGFVPL